MEIKWLREALQNLDREATYIAKDDPAAARVVVQRIHDAVGLLTGNPALGHPGRIDGTRELVIPDTRYIVPYRVMAHLNRVEILRVFHASRKLPESW
ncbi:MAG: type II toxin-antitoxin system RelE/ParE family toxin [Lysobacterales bacterium]